MSRLGVHEMEALMKTNDYNRATLDRIIQGMVEDNPEVFGSAVADKRVPARGGRKGRQINRSYFHKAQGIGSN